MGVQAAAHCTVPITNASATRTFNIFFQTNTASFDLLISPFAGFGEIPRAGFVYARFQ
jgi:hypothetical protein